MAIEIKVPALGESVSEATIARWFKKPGEQVKVDEPLVELETDKVTIEVPATLVKPNRAATSAITRNSRAQRSRTNPPGEFRGMGDRAYLNCPRPAAGAG